MDWFCLKCCEYQEESTAPFGDDVKCKFCGAIHETDYEESIDGYHCTIVKLKEQE